MELIPYSQFAKLRLKQLVSADMNASEDDGYEWLGGYGINEGIRGADFFRREQTPDETTGIELYFDLLPSNAAQAILDAIGLPLNPRMGFEQIYSVLGEPKEKDVFNDRPQNRQTDNFVIGSTQPYHVSCSVHGNSGLIGLSVVRGDVLSRIQAEEAAFLAELKAEGGNA